MGSPDGEIKLIDNPCTVNGCFSADWPEMFCMICGYREDQAGCEAWRRENNARLVMRDGQELP